MKQQYGLSEILRNAFSLINTKIFWRGARLIRSPFYMRGKNHFEYGKGLTTGYGCRFEVYSMEEKALIIGQGCKFGDRVHLSACEKVVIGDGCLFASNILVTDNQHGTYKGESQSSPTETPDERALDVKPVTIGSKVWIGDNVVILPGVTIGDGCIVGANSVVNKCFGSNVIIAGNPARVIKEFNGSEWILRK